MSRRIIFIVAFVVIFAPSGDVWAQQSACAFDAANRNGNILAESLTRIDSLFRNCTKAWEATLKVYALRLFWLLATIEFAWSAIRLVFRNADMNEWLGELVNQILFIGFFFALLENTTTWTSAIVGGFTEAADGVQRANGFADGSPSSVFNIGVTIATKIYNEINFAGISAAVQSLAVLLCLAFIVACFAQMAAAIILAHVESYVVLSAGVLFLGFGGSRWTKDFALKIIVYAVSVGAKLFLLQLIAGLGTQIISAWLRLPPGQLDATVTNVFIIFGSTIVLCVLMKSVPDMIQGLINGTSLGVNSGLVPAIGNLIRSLYAVGMMIQGARERAREDRSAHSGGDASAESLLTRTGHAVADTARGASYMPGVMREHIGNRLSGRAGKHYRAAQMGREMRDEARKAGEQRTARAGAQAKAQEASTTSANSPSQAPTQSASAAPGPAASENSSRPSET